MGLGDFYRQRRLAGAFALVSMLVYTALIPGHLVSQATMLLVQAELGTSAIPICRGGLGRTDQPTREPSKQTHCPICSGYAALQFALEGSGVALPLPPEPGSVLFDRTDDNLIVAPAPAPQSRGPPSLLT